VLADDPPRDVAVRALVQGFLAPFGVQRASLHVLIANGQTLRMVGEHGYPSDSTFRFVDIDMTIALPATEALRGMRPLVMTPPNCRSAICFCRKAMVTRMSLILDLTTVSGSSLRSNEMDDHRLSLHSLHELEC